VVDVSELETEFQPVGALCEGRQTTLIAPQLVFNFGFKENWEATLEGRLETPLSPAEPPRITDAALLLKDVLRPGSLQDKPGPSVATEFGLLLPDGSDESGLGARFAGIASQRWDWGTVHLNAAAALTPEQHADLFISTIIEGPSKWKVRPVAEVFYEDNISTAQTTSGLAGAIWQVRDNLSFDGAFRRAFTDGRPTSEIRAGVTFGFNTGLFGRRAGR
jgi:hypothetical protein